MEKLTEKLNSKTIKTLEGYRNLILAATFGSNVKVKTRYKRKLSGYVVALVDTDQIFKNEADTIYHAYRRQS